MSFVESHQTVIDVFRAILKAVVALHQEKKDFLL